MSVRRHAQFAKQEQRRPVDLPALIVHIEKGPCLSDHSLRRHKVLYGNEKSLLKSSKLSEARIRAIVKCFAADLTALQTARIRGVNRNTVNRIYRGLRERVFAACEAQCPFFGVVEVDESFFGARRVKGEITLDEFVLDLADGVTTHRTTVWRALHTPDESA